MGERLTNWARNVTFSARRIHRPASLAALQRLVAGSERIRALGSGHSFSRLADTPGDLVSVAGLPKIVRLDAERATVTVSAGLTYAELAPHLHAAGYALRNLGSLPHISIAGTCATGTHGSGNANGVLATAVSALEMITAEGDVLTLSRDGDGGRFRGAVVGLGALGIVTSLSLDIVPTFDVRQYVYEHLPREQLDEHLADILASAYSVSVFTDWRSSPIIRVWLKELVDGGGSPEPARQWYGARPADGPRHPVPGLPAVNCTQQMGVPGPWHERLPHFLPDFTPSVGDELQSEYLMPRQSAVSALRALDGIRDRLAPVLQVAEIRTVAADELWMSPSYQQDSVAFHFTWINDVPAVTPVLAGIEAQLAPFGARPHWGKLFCTSPEIVSGLYGRLPDFRRLLRDLDPAGKFRNELVDAYLPAGG
ncbi:MAG TPA: FAD-binding protein [Streptosporangiaceae bacterium]|nr:FAD-binding protein [Streptosporangiaceae bacterium]